MKRNRKWKISHTVVERIHLNTLSEFIYCYISKNITSCHCVRSVRIWSYSDRCFPAFELNTKRYEVTLRIQSECGKIRTIITPNTLFTQCTLSCLFLKLSKASSVSLICCPQKHLDSRYLDVHAFFYVSNTFISNTKPKLAKN